MSQVLVPFVLLVLLLSACTYHTNVSVTKRLAPGMSAQQVRAVMGSDPAQTQFVQDKWIWKYTLAEWGRGNVPYYLVFRQDNQTLIAWAADEVGAQRNHDNTMEMLNQIQRQFPPTQKSKVEVKIKRK